MIAPFIKRGAIERLLKSCDDLVSIKVIGRFLPEDVAAGVSDIAAAELVLHSSGAGLATHPLLHAKLYRADDRCLVGSANVTNRGLGWSRVSNEELLVRLGYVPSLKEFEERILLDADEMSWPRLRELQARARDLSSVAAGGPEIEEEDREDSDKVWLPTCRTPRYLFDVYSENEQWRLLDSARNAAKRDLGHFRPLPKNLDRAAFESIVRSGLRKHSLVRWLMDEGGVTDQRVLELKIRPITQEQEWSLDAEMLWEVYQEWLLYFLPREFRLVPSETKLSHGRRL